MGREDLGQFRRGTDVEWDGVDPVLAEGEPGFSINANELRIGNGSTPWSELPNIGAGGGGAGSPLTIDGSYDLMLTAPDDTLPAAAIPFNSLPDDWVQEVDGTINTVGTTGGYHVINGVVIADMSAMGTSLAWVDISNGGPNPVRGGVTRTHADDTGILPFYNFTGLVLLNGSDWSLKVSLGVQTSLGSFTTIPLFGAIFSIEQVVTG